MIKLFTSVIFAGIFTVTSTKNMTNIVVLGDSITYEGYWKNMLNRDDIINMGLNGDRTEGIYARADDALEHNPKVVFLMGGVNDFAAGKSVNDAYTNLRLTAEYFQKNKVKVVITSTLNVGDKAGDTRGWNSKINQLNTKLKGFSAKNKIPYIDLNKELAPNGKLLSQYTFDGVHIDLSAYQIWGKEVRTVLNEIGL